ncbi:MAG: WG repeat-containing protein, partial [Bacteroidota bacterium]
TNNGELSDIRKEICDLLTAFPPETCDLFDLKSIKQYREGFAAFETVSGWGYLDEERNVVISPTYFSAGPFINGLAKVQPDANNRWFINPRGEQVYTDVSATPTFKLLACRAVDNRKWGFINDQTHAVQIPFIYDEVEMFHRQFAKVRLGNSWGFIDLKGSSTFYGGIVYDEIKGDFRDDVVLATRGKQTVQLTFGEAVEKEDGTKRNDQPAKEDSDKVSTTSPPSDSGSELPPAPPPPGLPFTIEGKEVNGRILASQNGLFGFVARNITPAQNKQSKAPPSEYRIVISFQYANAFDFSYSRAAVRKKDGNWGFIDVNGTRKTSFTYDQVSAYRAYGKKLTLAKVMVESDTFFIDQEGKCVAYDGLSCPTTPMDDEISPSSVGESYVVPGNKDLTVFREGKLYGLRLTKDPNQILFEAKSTFRIDFKGQYARVRNKLGRWGMIDMQGKLVVRMTFQEILDFSNGLAAVKLSGKWGFVDTNGKLVIGFKFDDVIQSFAGDRAWVEYLGKKVTINKSGEISTRKTKGEY